MNNYLSKPKNNTLLRLLFTVIFCVLCIIPLQLVAQDKKSRNNKEVSIKGKITNLEGKPLQGVLIDLIESMTFAITDKQGAFTIKVPEKNSELQFSLTGYQNSRLKVQDERQLEIKLSPQLKEVDKNVELLYGVTQKESLITSAISTIWGEELEGTAAHQLSQALTGRIPGLTIYTSGGATPGSESVSRYMRGQRSWQSHSPYSFVDGRIRPYTDINPYEIEQISVYKDAGAGAVLGLRGSNGAMMITTRRGKEGRPILKFNSQLSIESPLKQPKFVDSWHYATLYNEALRNDNQPTVYTDQDFAMYLSGENPLTHPNVDWIKESIKENTLSQKYNLSIEGGSSIAKYFVNLSYMDMGGLYKTDDNVNTYNTNASAKRYSVRSNVDISITKSLELAVGLHGRQLIQNNPGGGSAAVFKTVYSLPSNIFPVNYGPDKVAGTNDVRVNPYGVLNHRGYSKYIHTTMESSIEAKQKLDFLTEGLRARASLSFDYRFDNTIDRNKSYQVYEYTGEDPVTGENLYNVWGSVQKQANNNSFGGNTRNFEADGGFDYNRVINKHAVSGSLIYKLLKESDNIKLPNTHQGLHSRFTYVYDSRYIAEFSFAYQGTEQLPPEKRWGFFPAGSLGWIASEESFIKNNIGDILSFLKFRGSYGKTGSDGGIPYFIYLPKFMRTGAIYSLGVNPVNVIGWREDVTTVPFEKVTWEEVTKLNLGIDTRLFDNRLSLGFDYFNEKARQILTTRASFSTILGLGAGKGPLGNVGEADNKGFELSGSFNGKIGNFDWTLGGNLSYATSEILFRDEMEYAYDYRYMKGNSVNTPDVGLFTTNGLYKDEQDRLNSPATSFGPSYPGDIKYRDVNGDGIVNGEDVMRLDQGNLGELGYSFYLSANYKGFDFNVFFTGIGKRTMYIDGLSIKAFTNSSGSGAATAGNVRQYHWDNRYNPGDPSTWETATYPRLTVDGSRTHNAQRSDFWQENGNFLRLKSLSFGYTLPQKLTQRLWMSKVRIFYSGYNLLTWDNMRTIDPEGSGEGFDYPLQRISSIGINIHF